MIVMKPYSKDWYDQIISPHSPKLCTSPYPPPYNEQFQFLRALFLKWHLRGLYMIRWLIDRVLRGLLNHYIVRSVHRSFFRPDKYPVIVQCLLRAKFISVQAVQYYVRRSTQIGDSKNTQKHSNIQDICILEAYKGKLDRWLLISLYLYMGCFWLLVQVL